MASMDLTRRDVWTLSALMAAALLFLAFRASIGRPRPFEILRARPPAAVPRIALNRASAAELEALPGVGPKTAAAIIARRPFTGPEDLRRVPGLGPRGRDRLAPRVRYDP